MTLPPGGDDEFGAFTVGPRLVQAGRPDGPLFGRTFVAKEVFDVAGLVTTAGNPDWARTHLPAEANAPAVDRLLAAGADLVGKALTDELAFSLSGTNRHYGTPRNPVAPGRVPGGSSSGSAVAVAAGLADFALGTDTGGSVRVPASYCGVAGLRPTWGRAPLEGVVALAPSFDTAGLFAADAVRLRAGVAALLDGWRSDEQPPTGRVVVCTDAFALADPAVTEALDPLVRILARLGGGRREDVLAADGPDGLGRWADAYRVLMPAEAWATHGAWIEATRPALGPGIGPRFEAGGRLGADEVAAAQRVRDGARDQVLHLCGDGRVLVLPAAPAVAPLLDEALGQPIAHQSSRRRVTSLTSPAGLAGAPSVSFGAAAVPGGRVNVALIGAPGTDEALLALAVAASTVVAHAGG